MTEAQRAHLRRLIAMRSTQGIVEAVHHSCSPGRLEIEQHHSDLVDEHDDVIVDTFNADGTIVSDGDVAYDLTGRANIDFIAAAWSAVPDLLDENDELRAKVDELTARLRDSGPRKTF